MAGQTLRVGNGAGFWGDNLDAPFADAEATLSAAGYDPYAMVAFFARPTRAGGAAGAH